MENDNLISVYLKLLGVLECPVCLDYLTKPVALCNEGHALCSKCKSNVSSCPMCRNPISMTRGLILDQVIETLIYPCYKMGCGSLLKRGEAENHDQDCSLDIASDKQAVLHNNLLKNIEENFASFIVQPEIVKETRTVGTVTGKTLTANALVQTALPFSVKVQAPMEALSSSETSGNTFAADGAKAGPSSGVSISWCDDTLSRSIKELDASKLPISHLQYSSPTLDSLMLTASNNFNKNDNHCNINSNPQNFQGFKFDIGSFKDLTDLITENNFESKLKPFIFRGSGLNSECSISRRGRRKPSTNLHFNVEKHSFDRKHVSDPSNNSTITPNPSSDMFVKNQASSSSSNSNLDEFCNRNSTPKSKPSTNLSINLSNTPLNSASNNNPLLNANSLLSSNNKKRPSTNLCGLAPA